ncbi:MAG: VOC family protein [Puniceicoccales bacterium]
MDDIVAHCAMLAENGVEVWPENWKEKFTTGGSKMAFITDPDGYEVEILEH